jgi:uncharacterized protein (TIGR00369 family)
MMKLSEYPESITAPDIRIAPTIRSDSPSSSDVDPGAHVQPAERQPVALPNRSAFLEASGITPTSISPDRVEGYIDLTEAHHTPWGIVHGGVYASAVESAGSVGGAAYAAKLGLNAVGTNNNTNFLRPFTKGRVEVTAYPIQQGRSQQLWQVDIADEGGRLISKGQLRVAHILPGSAAA